MMYIRFARAGKTAPKTMLRLLLALSASVLANGAAKAGDRFIELGCADYEFPEVISPLGGGSASPVFTCPALGIITTQGERYEAVNSSTHIHRARYETKKGETKIFNQNIPSSPIWTVDGFRSITSIDATSHFQGDAGKDVFSFEIRLETWVNGNLIATARVSDSIGSAAGNKHLTDVVYSGGAQKVETHVSKMITTMSGPGELHIGTTGLSQLNAVPEPATWAMMIAGFCGTGLAMRRAAARQARPAVA